MGGSRHRQRESDVRVVDLTPEVLQTMREVVNGIPERLSIDQLRILLAVFLEADQFVQVTPIVDELLVWRTVGPALLEHAENEKPKRSA